MTKEELAAMLDEMQFGTEISSEIKQIAMDNNLLIVYGAGDEWLSMCGMINRDYVCPSRWKIEDELPSPILVNRFDTNVGVFWSFMTDLPCAEFKIYEDDNLYCVGIVIDLTGASPKPIDDMCEICSIPKSESGKLIFKSTTISGSINDCKIDLSVNSEGSVMFNFEQYQEEFGMYMTVGRYYPRFCPNCGRRINEYRTK